MLAAAGSSLLAPAGAAANPPNAPSTASWVTNGTVDALAPAGDGSLLVGGSFDYLGPITGAGAAMATSNAAISMTSSVSGTIHTVAPDGFGGVYIGGVFTSVAGAARTNVAHIEASGAVSTWAPNVNGPVYALVTNGVSVWIGGQFTQVGGQPRVNLAQVLTTDNGAVTTFLCDADGPVRALGLFTSTLVVGGEYSNIGNGAGKSARQGLSVVGANSAAVLHPVANVVRDTGAGETTGSVRSFAIIGTTIYMGGDFDGIKDVLGNRTNRENLASFDGGALTLYPWNPKADKPVNAVTTDGSTIWAGGEFDVTGSAPRARLAAYTATTTAVNPVLAFDPGVGGGAQTVDALAVSGGVLYVGGQFTTLAGTQRTNLGAVNAGTGTINTTWRAAAGGRVLALAAVGGTPQKVYAGGSFTSVGGVYQPNLAKVDASGVAVTSWASTVDGPVRDITVLDGTAYVGGSFANAGGTARANAAAFDVATGALRPWAPNPNGPVRALAVEPGAVYLGGAFTSVRDAAQVAQARSRLAKVAPDGTLASFAPAADADVRALAVSAFGNDLYVGGSFTTLGGVARTRIGAVDRSTGAVSSWAPEAGGGDVLALAATTSAVYAGGSFTTIGGQSRSRLAALSTSTGAAESFTANADGTVNELAVTRTTLYAAGTFGTIGGQARSRLAGITAAGSVTAWSPAFAPAAAEAITTVGEVPYAGAAASAPDVSNRGLFAFTGGSAPSGDLRCGSGAPDCIRVAFPATLAWGALAPGGDRTSPEQAIEVVSNTTWGIGLSTDAADGRLREWDGSGYVPAGRVLGSPLQVALTSTDGTATTPAWANLSSSATAIGSTFAASDCTTIPESCWRRTAGVRLKQHVSFADPPLDGRSYRVVVTYDVKKAP